MRGRSLVAAAVATAPLAACARLSSRFTERLRVTAPVVLAPMGGCAGGALAAAVSASGGVGLVGSGGETLAFLRNEWSIALAHPGVVRENLGFGLNVKQLEEWDSGDTLANLLDELLVLPLTDIEFVPFEWDGRTAAAHPSSATAPPPNRQAR